MPTAYTSLLGLALPVTGELSGTWGDTVNNYITQYVDAAVAGVQTISGSQTAVTLSVTNGSSLVTAGAGATGSAQFQIINCTGNPAGLLTITTPASSRQYIIINATSTSQSVKIVGTGPTTGVTLVAGEKAHVAWNGSDFVKIATQNGSGDFVTVDTTNLEVTNIKAKDGTASMVLTDSTGAVDISKAVTMSATTQNIALGTSQTSGTFTVGGAAQTGTQTFDQSTKTHTLNLGTGATENTLTKTINLGTAGVSGSTTTITVGSTNGTTTTLNGTVTAATLNSTTIDTTNIEVTNIKAKDGTAAIVLTDSTGAVGISTAVTMSATTQNIALGTSQTTGTFTVGGAAQTGIQTFDQSTKTHTLNLGTGATENTLTKTINIGTAGVSGSTTSIAIGSTNGTTTTINGAITASATTQNISLGASQTTGTFAAGGAAQTGTLTFDPSTKTHTLNIGTGATESAATKTINLGTAGVATSTTAINIGSTNGTTITLNGTVNATTLDLTNIEVTNIKAKDGTASMTLADTTGIITLSATAGTANGVAYLNGSRALTTGSALTFDGTKLGVASGNIDVVSASFVGSPLIAARFNASNLRMGIGIGNSNGFPFLGVNVNNAANDNGTFDINGYASRIRLDNGVFQVQTSSVSGTAGNAITWTTPLYLEADGDLGVGTTSPGTRLHASIASGTAYTTSSTGNVLTVSNTTASGYAGIAFNTEPSAGNAGLAAINSFAPASGDSVLAFSTRGSATLAERMRLDSSGNLGIGTTSPFTALSFPIGTNKYVGQTAPTAHLAGNAGSMGFGISDGGGQTGVFVHNTHDGTFSSQDIRFLTAQGGISAATERARISSDGTFRVKGAGTAGSTDAVQFSGSAPASSLILDSSGRLEIGGTFALGRTLNVDSATDGYTVSLLQTGAFNSGKLAGTVYSGYYDGSSITDMASIRGGKENTTSGNYAGMLAFYTRPNGGSDTERARITSGGVFLVNTTSQLSSGSYGVHEIRGDAGSGGQSALVVYNTNASDASPAINAIKHSSTTTSSQRFIQFYANAGSQAMGGIVGNGAENVQFATISDVREKTNIQPVGGSLEKIVALKPVSFDWIKSGEHVKAGFVAQDVEQVFPEFVVENMANDGEEARKGLTGGMTGGIIAHLVAAIKEQQAMINELKAEVAALKGA